MHESNIFGHVFDHNTSPNTPRLIKTPTISYTMNPGADTYMHTSKPS